jgi:GMP synthase PP-ATPase subunit
VEVQVQVQAQVRELEEQELPLQEAQAQEQEVLLQGQEALLLLAKVREQVLRLEVLLRAQAGVLAQVEAQVLDLALEVGLQQVVLEQGQLVLARVQEQAQAEELLESELALEESLVQGEE